MSALKFCSVCVRRTELSVLYEKITQIRTVLAIRVSISKQINNDQALSGDLIVTSTKTLHFESTMDESSDESVVDVFEDKKPQACHVCCKALDPDPKCKQHKREGIAIVAL